MGAIEVISDDWISNEFFAPAATDLVSGLMGEYRRARGWIDEAAAFVLVHAADCVLGCPCGYMAYRERRAGFLHPRVKFGV